MLGQLTERKWSATIAGRIQSRNHPSQFACRTSAKKFWTSCDRVAGSQSATFSSTWTLRWLADPRSPKCEPAGIEITRQRQELKHSCGTPSNHLSQHLLCGRSPCPPCLPRGICKWMCFPVDSFDGCFASSNPKPAPQFAATHKILSALPGSYPISTARPLRSAAIRRYIAVDCSTVAVPFLQSVSFLTV